MCINEITIARVWVNIEHKANPCANTKHTWWVLFTLTTCCQIFANLPRFSSSFFLVRHRIWIHQQRERKRKTQPVVESTRKTKQLLKADIMYIVRQPLNPRITIINFSFVKQCTIVCKCFPNQQNLINCLCILYSIKWMSFCVLFFAAVAWIMDWHCYENRLN